MDTVRKGFSNPMISIIFEKKKNDTRKLGCHRIPCSLVRSRSKIICIINIFMITKCVGHESF